LTQQVFLRMSIGGSRSSGARAIALREGIRDYYRHHFPLTDAARARLQRNPGDGMVSKLCHGPSGAGSVEPNAGAAFAGGRLTLLEIAS
jgi:hypothetical protein